MEAKENPDTDFLEPAKKNMDKFVKYMKDVDITDEYDKASKQSSNTPIFPYVSVFIFLWFLAHFILFPFLASIPPLKFLAEKQYPAVLAILCIAFSIFNHGVLMGFLLGVKSIRHAVFTAFLISSISIFITFVSLTMDSIVQGNLIRMFENSIGYYFVFLWYRFKGFDLNTVFGYYETFLSQNTNQDLSFLLTLFDYKDVDDLDVDKINGILQTKAGENIFQFKAAETGGEDKRIPTLKEMVVAKYRIGCSIWFFITSIFEVMVNLKFLLNI